MGECIAYSSDHALYIKLLVACFQLQAPSDIVMAVERESNETDAGEALVRSCIEHDAEASIVVIIARWGNENEDVEK